MDFGHVSVLLNECIEGLNIKRDGIYLDGTLGGSGHSLEILKRLSPDGLLIGIDRDEAAIDNALKTLSGFPGGLSLVRGNFINVKSILTKLEINGVDGILLDLGVSSKQLDDADRGFSYMADAPLDMRMDRRDTLTAYDVVNSYSKSELAVIIRDYSDERWADRIAEFIVAERSISPIKTTFELVSVIKKAIPKSARMDGPHPAKRTFQSIRCEVNNELENLENSIYDLVDKLNSGGRICVISFHSLEDVRVKNALRTLENPCTCPRDFPVCVCGKKPSVKIITKKPIVPTDDEIEQNSRSRSAKLRIAEKI